MIMRVGLMVSLTVPFFFSCSLNVWLGEKGSPVEMGGRTFKFWKCITSCLQVMGVHVIYR